MTEKELKYNSVKYFSNKYDIPSFELLLDLCYHGRLDVLLIYGSKILDYRNSRLFCGEAAYGNSLETLKYLRSIGMPWDYITTNLASQKCHTKILKYCLDNGCELGYSVLNNLARHGKLSMIKYIVESGKFKDDYNGDEAIVAAASKNNFKIVEYLYEAGFEGRETLLDYAVAHSNMKMLTYLYYKRGCNIIFTTTLELCLRKNSKESLEVIRFCLKHDLIRNINEFYDILDRNIDRIDLDLRMWRKFLFNNKGIMRHKKLFNYVREKKERIRNEIKELEKTGILYSDVRGIIGKYL